MSNIKQAEYLVKNIIFAQEFKEFGDNEKTNSIIVNDFLKLFELVKEQYSSNFQINYENVAQVIDITFFLFLSDLDKEIINEAYMQMEI